MLHLQLFEKGFIGMNRLSIFAAAAAACLLTPNTGNAEANKPDYRRAYTLATAAYCSYAVTELEAENGRPRAARCLKAAAADDKVLREALGETPDIEAYVDPNSPENAYLLARIKDGVVLAFRGTITPPIDPKGNIFKATADSAAKYNDRAVKGFRTFLTDWLNNTQAGATTQGRHKGFDRAWQPLLARLKTESKFPSFLAGLNSAEGEKLYIAGHSKGGALAILAALDIPQSFAVSPITYTFSAAKAFTSDEAANVIFPSGTLWRFERSDDIVPALPSDRSFQWPGFTPYAHIGGLVLFDGSVPKLSLGSVNGLYQPTDSVRIVHVLLRTVTPDILFGGFSLGDPSQLAKDLNNVIVKSCRNFVDSHFRVFTDVGAQVPDANQSGRLFAERLQDGEGDVLWGYREWCSLAALPE